MASIAQCAKHLKMNERTFKVLLDSGVFKRATRNNYDLTLVRETYIEHLRAEASGRGESGSGDLTEARTRVAQARAESAEWENEKMKGGWVIAEDAAKFFFAELMVLRENLLSAPGKIADSLMQAANREDAYGIAYAEIWEAMGRMARGRDAVTFAIECVERSGGKKAMIKFLKDFEADVGEWGWDETGKVTIKHTRTDHV